MNNLFPPSLSQECSPTICMFLSAQHIDMEECNGDIRHLLQGILLNITCCST